MIEEFKKRGIKVLNWYWTLGRYAPVFIFKASSEKDALKVSTDIAEWVATETLVAIPRQEAINLLQSSPKTQLNQDEPHRKTQPILPQNGDCVRDCGRKNSKDFAPIKHCRPRLRKRCSNDSRKTKGNS